MGNTYNETGTACGAGSGTGPNANNLIYTAVSSCYSDNLGDTNNIRSFYLGYNNGNKSNNRNVET